MKGLEKFGAKAIVGFFSSVASKRGPAEEHLPFLCRKSACWNICLGINTLNGLSFVEIKVKASYATCYFKQFKTKSTSEVGTCHLKHSEDDHVQNPFCLSKLQFHETKARRKGGGGVLLSRT